MENNGFLGLVVFNLNEFNGELVADTMSEILSYSTTPPISTYIENVNGNCGFVFHSETKTKKECLNYFTDNTVIE